MFSYNDLYYIKKNELQKKYDFSGKKVLQAPAPIRKYPLTGGAEALDGAPDGSSDYETQKNTLR
jgi:hypothetical protein